MWRGHLLRSMTLSGVWCTPVRSCGFSLPFMLGFGSWALTYWSLDPVTFSSHLRFSTVPVVLEETCLTRPNPTGSCIIVPTGRYVWGTTTSPVATSLFWCRTSAYSWLKTSWGSLFYLTTPGPLGVSIATFITVFRRILPCIAFPKWSTRLSPWIQNMILLPPLLSHLHKCARSSLTMGSTHGRGIFTSRNGGAWFSAWMCPLFPCRPCTMAGALPGLPHSWPLPRTERKFHIGPFRGSLLV